MQPDHTQADPTDKRNQTILHSRLEARNRVYWPRVGDYLRLPRYDERAKPYTRRTIDPQFVEVSLVKDPPPGCEFKQEDLPLNEEMKVFEMIPLIHKDGAEPTVNARDLHAYMKVGKVFGAWIQERIAANKFVENEDFVVFSKSGKNPQGGRPTKDYHVTLDMAKELAMLENSDLGRAARRYFIACEKQLRAALKASVATKFNFEDPVIAARLFIEAEEGRRAALAMLDESNAKV